MTMKILLADDQPNVRSALRLILEQAPAWQIAGEVDDADALWKTIQATCPDVVLLDWELPGLHRSESIRRMRHHCATIIVVAMSSQIDSRKSAQDAHVDAFISKGDPPEVILDTLRSIADSQFTVPDRHPDTRRQASK